MAVERNICYGTGNHYHEAFHVEAFATTLAVLDEMTGNTHGGTVNVHSTDDRVNGNRYDLLYHALCNFVNRHVLDTWEPRKNSFAQLHDVKSAEHLQREAASFDLSADDVVMKGGYLPHLTQTMQQVASYRFTWSNHHPVEAAEMTFIENGLHAIVRDALDAHRGVVE